MKTISQEISGQIFDIFQKHVIQKNNANIPDFMDAMVTFLAFIAHKLDKEDQELFVKDLIDRLSFSIETVNGFKD